MSDAEVGDDEYGDDSTTIRLQEFAAERLGKAAALFVPSGTMANSIAGRVFLRPYDVVVCEARCAIYQAGHFSGISADFKTIDAQRGLITEEQLWESLGADGYRGLRPRLFVLENSFNMAGGVALSPEYVQSIAGRARGAGAAVYLDGARIFNAAVALGADVKALAAPADAMMFCLSKGLGAPIGSMLVGPDEFIVEARRIRKRLGGQMRQTGVVAAAGIVALEQMVDRLAEDHARARRLAEALAEAPGLEIDLGLVETNMVWLAVKPLGVTSYEFVDVLKERGVLGLAYSGGRVRFVTHKDVSDSDIDGAIRIILACVSDLAARRGRQVPKGMSKTIAES